MPRLPRLHVIVGDGVVGAEGYRERLRPIVTAGSGALALHLRTRSTSARRLFEAARWLSGVSRETGTPVLVNDRVDVAVAAGAAGVHLREDSLPVSAVRRIAGERLLVGRSIHSTDQAAGPRRSGLDYLVLGAVYPTRSHPDRRALGVDAVAAAVTGSDLPVLAIGGITPSGVPDVLARGAHGVVVLSGVWSAENPQRAVTRYLEALGWGGRTMTSMLHGRGRA